MSISIPIDQGYYLSESRPISAQDCVNLYPNAPQTNTVTQGTLIATPGLTNVVTSVVTGVNRGGHQFNGSAYTVNGTDLFEITETLDSFGKATYSATKRNGATSIPGSGRVIMANNGTGNQLCIIIPDATNQFNGFIYNDDTNVFVQISDVDFDGPVKSVIYIDGFFLFVKTDGTKFFISSTKNGLAYSATDFADAEVDPDPNQGAFALNNQLFIFGSITTEPFDNRGGSGFPYKRISNASLEKGLTSPHAITEMNGLMVWLGGGEGEQPAIWASNGGTPEKLSNTAMDNQFRTYTSTQLSDCYVNKYSQAGELFIAFTFPGQATFVYGYYAQKWHRRESIDSELVVPWRVSSIIRVYDVFLVGDTLTANIGRIDKDVFTEYGDTTRRSVTLPPIDNGGDPFFIDSIEVFLESGRGLTTGEFTDPQIGIRFSDNGGRTFGSAMLRSAGEIGEYLLRTIVNRQGRVARERMYRLEMSDPIKWVIIKVEANIDRAA